MIPVAVTTFPKILEITQPIKENNSPPCWKTNKADWQKFKNLCNTKLVQDPNCTVLIKHFTETLIAIANKTILKNSTSNKHNTPWFNKDCKIAIREQNAALRKFQKETLACNLNSFKQLKAKARKTIKQAKRTSWQNFVNQLNSSTKTNSLENGTKNCWQKSTYSPQASH